MSDSKSQKDLQIFGRSTEDIIRTALNSLIEGMTGVLTSSRNDCLFSISLIYQRSRGGNFLNELLEEWNKYREKSKVKEDYQFSEQHKVCLQELLDFLENDSPDEVRFLVLKKIFLVAGTEKISDRNDLFPQEFMKIARKLTDGEIILLKAVFDIAIQRKFWSDDPHYSADSWIKEVTKESKLKYTQLVEIYEKNLMDKKLITPRFHPDGSGVHVKPHFRLTALGFNLCQYIASYEE